MSDEDAVPAGHATTGHGVTGKLPVLVLGCIGVVYGDIGTSPLYAMRESLRAAGENGLVREDVMGIVSLLLWTLILIVSVKYVVLIMRADNRGKAGRCRWLR
jgi:KUP system potassium uptake protein